MLILALLLACSTPEPAPPPATPDRAEALARAEAAAKTLGQTLKARVVQAMTEGGPTAAVEVCSTEAQALTKQIGEETGVSVGRSSLRLRNPENAGPDWVTAWLTELGERPAAGVEPLRSFEDGRARVALPIPLEAPCAVCHGPREAIPPEVAALIEARYPQDRATGYAVGDLRGALWAEAR